MLRLFLSTIPRYLALLKGALLPPRGGICRLTPRHVLLVLPLLLALPLLVAYHALGMLLDELFFRGYRRVPVREPLFVLGVPRSGTTALHEHLARDRRFTTFSTWECLFASSVSWRRLWLAVARIDGRLGRPGGRLLVALERRIAGSMEDVHPFRLAGPEEDYFVFLPVLWCFILIVPFPDARWLWDYTDFEERVPPRLGRRLMAYYRKCIQKHLYVHGPDRVFLSKNAAFAPLARALGEGFPDARFVCCLREPERALSSQLSTLEPAFRALHGDWNRQRFGERMARAFLRYYRDCLAVFVDDEQARAAIVPMPAQKQRPAEAIRRIYRLLELELSPAYEQELERIDRKARGWRSPHRHELDEQVELGPELSEALRELCDRFDFRAGEVIAPGRQREPATAVGEP